MNKIIALTLAATAFTALPASAASLNGKTISLNISESNNGSFGTHTVVAGSGNEGNFFNNQFFQVGSNTFTIRSVNPYCGYVCAGGQVTFDLTGLDFGTPITGITFDTSLTGVMSSFTADTATFSFADQSLPAATYLSATFLTGGTGGVPEPANWALMIGGFGVVGGVMRRRSNTVTTRVSYAA